MTREEILNILGDKWPEVRSLISAYMYSDVDLLNRTNEAVLENSGKMLRPMVTLLTAGAVSAIDRDSLLLAAFSEILHNATLMHDDVTDRSRTRRGRPSVMSMLGPSAAVLMGDFWLARAMEILSDTSCRNRVEKLFSRTITDLAEGEMLQLEKSMSLDTDEDAYYRIISCKTASLFRASCLAAAIASGADQSMQDAVSEYGLSLGLAFQVKDDILDYEGTGAMGKPVGVDVKEKKITLPLLGALKNSPERREEIIAKLSEVSEHEEYCREIMDFVVHNGGIEYAVETLSSLVKRAVASLDALKPSPYRNALVAIAEFNYIRQK